MEKTIKYIGAGSYIDGIPARDLTEIEWKTHKDTILLCPTAHDLYCVPESAPVAGLGIAEPVVELAGINNG